MVKANEIRAFQNFNRVRRCMEYMLNQKLIAAAKTNCNKLEIKLYDFDCLEKEVIKQLLVENGYKIRMTTWDDSVIIEW